MPLWWFRDFIGRRLAPVTLSGCLSFFAKSVNFVSREHPRPLAAIGVGWRRADVCVRDPAAAATDDRA